MLRFGSLSGVQVHMIWIFLWWFEGPFTEISGIMIWDSFVCFLEDYVRKFSGIIWSGINFRDFHKFPRRYQELGDSCSTSIIWMTNCGNNRNHMIWNVPLWFIITFTNRSGIIWFAFHYWFFSNHLNFEVQPGTQMGTLGHHLHFTIISRFAISIILSSSGWIVLVVKWLPRGALWKYSAKEA